jgi:hypothetical protein
MVNNYFIKRRNNIIIVIGCSIIMFICFYGSFVNAILIDTDDSACDGYYKGPSNPCPKGCKACCCCVPFQDISCIKNIMCTNSTPSPTPSPTPPPTPPPTPCPPSNCPFPVPCGPCVTDYEALIHIDKTSVPTTTSFTFVIANNTSGMVQCLDYFYFKCNSLFNGFNQGTIKFSLTRLTNGTAQSPVLFINSLRDPFANILYKFQSYCGNSACQLAPGDKILLFVTLGNSPVLNNDLDGIAVISIDRRCTKDKNNCF